MAVQSELDELRREVTVRRRQAFRPGTQKNHLTQFRAYLLFCAYFHLDYINPSSETLCLYTEFLTHSFKSPGSTKNYMSGVRLLHKFLHEPCEEVDSFELSLLLRAIDITSDHQPKKKLPITVDILHALIQALDLRTYVGKLYRCVF